MAKQLNHRNALIFVFITVLLDMVGFGLIIPVQPALISQVGHVDLAQASEIGGWLFFAFSMCQFLFGPTLGNLSDAYGRRPLLLIAVFGLGCDYLVTALAPSLTWLFFGRAFAGICGASYVIANALVADITAKEDRAKAFDMMGAAFGLGFVIGPAIGGLLGSFGPRVPFYVAAAISLLNFAFGYFALPETLAPENRRAFDLARANPLGTFNVFRQNHQVWPLAGLLGLFVFATSVYPAVWTYWATAKFGWNSALIGATLFIFGLTMALSQGLLSGPLVKRLGERRLAQVGLFFGAVSACLYGLATGLWPVIAILLIHTPEGFVHPMLTALMSHEVPENAQGELQGGLGAIMNISMALGTVFYSNAFAWFLKPNGLWTSPDIGFFIAFGLMLLANVYLVFVPRQKSASS